MKLIAGFVDVYLRLNAEEEILFKADIAQLEPEKEAVVMDIVTSWMEEGLRQGLQQGLQQGELAIVQLLLTQRIGTIPPELQEIVSQLSLAQLENLAKALLNFSSTEDLRNWLQQI
ncbi:MULTISPECIES: DUF4351 domain-containing protein [Kamptonema]|uniref:DUF4351 domain-containing protein n=1 Tax=Kamptonema TaxID=1501433 RepID=UPI0011D29E80|nr:MULTISPECIES: DUF4351 domain-containing protein [Kamptonema]